ncbi:MAG: YibE/F family protein [Candidatus Pacebacteria bacterium]|jgi:uncharacterized membrane protein|nr:YibE/F family protein [Candidatus Paceibacterota bacterium]MBT4652194.1 YibE/F family protein [Candidatus Paceibacterota bacterium]MBT6756625.1 YibE/F family protein [Candidatus Paceibacterota bacterium]MBT6920875.1 YibE/F family protein [Candidatus Paceibacterota bacterium]
MQSTKEATITRIVEQGEISENENIHEFQKLELSLKNSKEFIEITHYQAPFSIWNPYSLGEKVVLQQNNQQEWIITDYVRQPALFQLGTIFVFLVIAIGKWWGFRSLLSLATSFFIIFGMILPLILNGWSPLLATLLGSLIIVPVTFYLSHGIKPKTHIAVISTLIALTISGLLATIFMDKTKLTGFSSEEAGFLSVMTENKLDIRGLLLAGIIISLLGTLDDIAVSQSSFVQQLKEANPKIKFKELFKRAMKVGQDHISSMINTLILVYAGASLPLLLLFLTSEANPMQIINLEIVAEEIVRTLSGSIGIVLAAPITTFLAAAFFTNHKNTTKKLANKKKEEEVNYFH